MDDLFYLVIPVNSLQKLTSLHDEAGETNCKVYRLGALFQGRQIKLTSFMDPGLWYLSF